MHKYRNDSSAKSIAAFWGKSLKDKDWYAIETKGDTTEIRIYDIIGWPFVDADTFVSDLSNIDSPNITVGINSPGGDVFDGTAIYNALKNHPAKITTRIDGIAASMASIIALAGDEIQIADNAYFMIHNPWSIAAGDYRDFKKESELLDKIGSTLALTYSNRTGISIDDVKALMDDETWIVGSELVEKGFADTVIEGKTAKASFDLGMYSNAPKDIKGEKEKHPVKTERELERVLTQDAGLTRSQAKAIIKSGFKPSNVTQDADNDEILQAFNKLIKQMRT